jgi:hypothetical protein
LSGAAKPRARGFFGKARYYASRLSAVEQAVETLGIASASKAFTSLAVAISTDEGKLSFDDSPKKLLPFFKLRDIGTVSEYFDGSAGGTTASFGSPFALTGKLLESARISADFYAPLNWKTLYRHIKIKRISKIGVEEVYVVEKTPESGLPVIDYISAKSFPNPETFDLYKIPILHP